MSYNVDEAAIAAMEATANQLEALGQQLHQAAELLQSAFDENRGGLGAHTGSIQALLDEVKETEEDASRPVKKLVLKLQKAMLVRIKHLENDRYKGKGRGR